MKNLQGWVLSNNEKGDIVIQKDDNSDRFKSDDEATKFVVESYRKLLKACQAVIGARDERLILIDSKEYKALNLCHLAIAEAEGNS